MNDTGQPEEEEGSYEEPYEPSGLAQRVDRILAEDSGVADPDKAQLRDLIAKLYPGDPADLEAVDAIDVALDAEMERVAEEAERLMGTQEVMRRQLEMVRSFEPAGAAEFPPVEFDGTQPVLFRDRALLDKLCGLAGRVEKTGESLVRSPEYLSKVEGYKIKAGLTVCSADKDAKYAPHPICLDVDVETPDGRKFSTAVHLDRVSLPWDSGTGEVEEKHQEIVDNDVSFQPWCGIEEGSGKKVGEPLATLNPELYTFLNRTFSIDFMLREALKTVEAAERVSEGQEVMGRRFQGVRAVKGGVDGRYPAVNFDGTQRHALLRDRALLDELGGMAREIKDGVVVSSERFERAEGGIKAAGYVSVCYNQEPGYQGHPLKLNLRVTMPDGRKLVVSTGLNRVYFIENLGEGEREDRFRDTVENDVLLTAWHGHEVGERALNQNQQIATLSPELYIFLDRNFSIDFMLEEARKVVAAQEK